MNLSQLSPPRVVGQVPFRAITPSHFDLAPGGRHVALFGSRSLELFDEHGVRLALLHRDDVQACGCFLDDQRLVVARFDGSLLLLRVEALRVAGTLRDAAALALGEVVPGAPVPLARMALSPDGALVAVACGEPLSKSHKPDKAVRVLDAATLAPRLTLKGMRRRTADLAFSADGRQLAVAGDAVVRVYELARGKAIGDVGDADDEGVAWRSDGALLTLGRTGGIRAWSVADRSFREQHPFSQQILRGPRVTPDGAVIVLTGGSFEPMIVHRLEAASLRPLAARRFDHLPAWPDAPRVTRDGAVWVPHGYAFRELRGPELAPVAIADGHEDHVRDFAVHPDGRWAATGDSSSNILVWDLDAGRVVHSFAVETKTLASGLVSTCPVKSLAISSKAPRVFLATERGGLRCWDAAAGAPAWSLEPEAFPLPVRIFPTPEGDAVLAVTGVTNGRPALSLVDSLGRTRWQTTVDSLPDQVHWDDDAVVLFDLSGSLRLRRSDGALTDVWRVPSSLMAHYRSALAVSEDGATAAAATALGRLVVWKTERAEVLCAADPRPLGMARITGMRWSPDGGLLVLDDDRRVDERDPVTLALRSSLELPMPARWTVFVVRQGRRLVVPTHEGPWLIYDLP